MEVSKLSPNYPLIDPVTEEGHEVAPIRTKEEIEEKLREMNIQEIKCGIGSFTPKFLQRLACKEVYLIVYCLVGMVIGMFFTYCVSVISTLEKRFDLNSKQTGIMLAGNDVSQVLLSVVIAYFGNYGNRPNLMGIGVVFASISCFIATTPHLIYGSGDAAEGAVMAAVALAQNVTTGLSSEKLCPNTEPDHCSANSYEDASVSYNVPIIILFISQFFLGVSISSYYTIGIVYLDDNVSKKEMPLFYSISMLVRVIGPVFGFFLGSRCLAVWIDPTEDPGITMEDPQWLGAWWLGFLLLGTILAALAILFFCFPRQLPSSLAGQVERLEHATMQKLGYHKQLSIDHYFAVANQKKEHSKPSLKKLPAALKRLVTNKIWLGNSFNTVVFLLAISGYWSFNPKYVETQFHKTASDATYYTGIASLISSMLGILLGGLVVRWKQPRARLVTGYSIFITLFSSAGMFVLMYIGCPKTEVVGYNELCSSDCQCADTFLPVCSEFGTTFYSACFAGCTGSVQNGSEVTFTNCSCISPPYTAANSSMLPPLFAIPPTREQAGTATMGYCHQDCNSLLVYIVVTIICKMVGASGRVGGVLVYLRSVSEEDKALALGTLTVLMSLFSFIPGPIIMGSIVDSSCLIWDNNCGQKGSCWLYDSDNFREVMHLFTGGIILLSILGDIVVFIYSKDLNLYDEPEEDIEMYVKENNNMNGEATKDLRN